MKLVVEILTLNDWSHIRFEKRKLEHKNWNEEWEKNFSPSVYWPSVWPYVRLSTNSVAAEFELVIEPKMSFGTGHHPNYRGYGDAHACTKILKDKTVLDFGSGTGVLAILAEKLGANRNLGN
jgi:ribosomal protein L11 methyltransferase